MKYLFQNALALTMDDAFTVLPNASVAVDGGKIVAVGKIPSAFQPERTIDCHGDILMPAFINCHAHSAMTLMRSAADDLPLADWLNTQIFPLERHLTPEDVYWGSMLAYLEYVRGGIATIGDMYYFPDSIFAAAEKSGLNVVMTGGATDFGGEAEKSAALEEERYVKLNGKIPNFKYIIGAHSEYLTTDDLISRLVGLSAKYKCPLYTHMSETLKEVGECTVRNDGLTPPLYLHRMGFFEHGATVAHGVHTDGDDIAVLAQSGVSVVTNPASNLKLASGIAPVYTMLQNGVNVALGTDGAASNNALDFFREMYLLSTLQKCRMADASVLSAEETLKIATKNGAKALFLENCGEVKAGNRADLIRISLNAPHYKPENNVVKNVVYSGCRTDVVLTMAGGKILYENGETFIGETPEEIYRNAEKSIRRLQKEAGKAD